MWHGVRVTTPPVETALTLAAVKGFLRVTEADEDNLISQMITDATARFDGPAGIGIALMPQSWTCARDAFCNPILLPGAPITGVTSVTYIDQLGVAQVLPDTDYRVDVTSEPARLRPAYGKSWPATQKVDGAVQVEYQLGYAAAADIPGDLIGALRVIIGLLYKYREEAIGDVVNHLPMGAQETLRRHRRLVVAA